MLLRHLLLYYYLKLWWGLPIIIATAAAASEMGSWTVSLPHVSRSAQCSYRLTYLCYRYSLQRYCQQIKVDLTFSCLQLPIAWPFSAADCPRPGSGCPGESAEILYPQLVASPCPPSRSIFVGLQWAVCSLRRKNDLSLKALDLDCCSLRGRRKQHLRVTVTTPYQRLSHHHLLLLPPN